MTFLGFSISPDGDLIDQETKEIIERGLVSKTLFADLQAYGALSSEEYDEQNKYVLSNRVTFSTTYPKLQNFTHIIIPLSSRKYTCF